MNKSLRLHKLESVQGLRAIAAAAVVLYHVLYMLGHNAGYHIQMNDLGAHGVDLFFIISGFIIYYTSAGLFTQPNAAHIFMRKRLIRVLPMYWLCTTLVAVILYFVPHLFAATAFSWDNTLSSYFFLLSKNSAGQIGTITQTGWTLCYEAYFYLLFTLLLFVPKRYFIASLTGLFLIGILIGDLLSVKYTWMTVATDPLLLEFSFGVLVSFLFLTGCILGKRTAILSFMLAVISMLFLREFDIGAWSRTLEYGIPCTILVISAISLERHGMLTPRWLIALGNSSYSLYLIHPFILPVLGKVWLTLHLTQHIPAAVLGCLALVSSLIAGHVVYLLVEKPLTRWFTRTWPERAPARLDVMTAPSL